MAPGIIRMEKEDDIFLEEVEKDYPPDYYLAFDNQLFETYFDFLKYIKQLILDNTPIDPTKQFIVKETLTDSGSGTDYFHIRFGEYTLNLKIPQKSDILNIEREYVILTFWRGLQIIIREQPIFKFSDFVFRLKGLFGW